ncbi:MAG: ribonuclease HI family protein [Chloroflexi bacterium]|nr:ribonuclease HI family protein [Chloroflexota bacterium]
MIIGKRRYETRLSTTSHNATPDKVYLYADGAARGNPGPAAIGAVIRNGAGNVLAEVSQAIGVGTNNQAEYRALIAGLEAAAHLGAQEIAIRMDSELVVRQLQGRYRVRHPGLIPLNEQVRRLLTHFAHVEVAHVPREQNREADALANRALDAWLK